MTLFELHDYISSQYGVDYAFLFRQDPTIAIFKRADTGKWFAATKDLPYRTMGIDNDGTVGVIDVKLGPLIVTMLHSGEGSRPAYHMNRDNWISILLDGSVDDEEIEAFIDMSYELAGGGAKKR